MLMTAVSLLLPKLIRKGATYEEIHDITKIDLWFIDKIAHLVEMEQTLKNETLTPEILAEAKRMEFPDAVIANYTGMTEREIHDMRHENGIVASFKMVDTCAAEFEAEYTILLQCVWQRNGSFQR